MTLVGFFNVGLDCPSFVREIFLRLFGDLIPKSLSGVSTSTTGISLGGALFDGDGEPSETDGPALSSSALTRFRGVSTKSKGSSLSRPLLISSRVAFRLSWDARVLAVDIRRLVGELGDASGRIGSGSGDELSRALVLDGLVRRGNTGISTVT